MARKLPSKTKKPAVHRAVDDALDMSFAGSSEENGESRSVASKERLRDQLDDAVALFLASGGKVEQVDPNVSATPPQKPPSSNNDELDPSSHSSQ